MMISKSSQYAIQALVYIGFNKNRTPVLSRELALHLSISRVHASKVLNALRKNGILTSKRGIQGGYSLKQELKNINLMQIFLITEGLSFGAHET